MTNATTQPSQADREELKPCPFCGGTADWGYNMTMAFCKSCGATAFWKKWNTRFERDTEKRVRDNAAWARLETWGEAQKVCQHGLDGLTFASDVSEERRTAVRSGIELCIAAIHQASRHDPKAQPSLGSLPPESLVGEANVERVAQALQDHMEQHHGIVLKASEWDAAALATLERTTDAG